MTDVAGSGPPPNPPATPQPWPGASGRGFGLKLLLVCALAVLMAIPALFVFGVLDDRQKRAREVDREISDVRGGEQRFLGPVLIAPYLLEQRRTVEEDDEVKEIVTYERRLYAVYPERGEAKANVTTEELRRSIYKVPVYEADIALNATFDMAAARESAGALPVDWDAAVFVVGANALKGARLAELAIGSSPAQPLEPFSGFVKVRDDYARDITEEVARSVDSVSFTGAPQIRAGYGLAQAPASGLARASEVSVSATLQFTGARRISFAPFAKETDITVTGDWPHPSFDGGLLPISRSVSDDGFEASWRVPYLARGAGGAGDPSVVGFANFDVTNFGVSFVQLLNVYQIVGRALKYALMFIGFVFLAYFLFEALSGARVHAAQYVLIGLMQATFYLLLLAFAEQFGFDLAFAIAASATVAATSLYAAAAFKGIGHSLRALLVFGAVYGLMYLLLRLEDYALVVGASACFLALATTMVMTRNIDWYGDKAARSVQS